MKNSLLKIRKLKNQPENDSFLYRYLTIDKLIDILIKGRLPLTRLNLFDDRLEGITKEHLLLNLTSDNLAKDFSKVLGGVFNYVTTNFNPSKRNSLRRQRIDFQKFNYACCWFVSDHESIAMWQLYSNPNSVAIKIPYLSLTQQIENHAFELSGYDHESIQFGNIQYYKFDDIDSLSDLVIEEDFQGFVKDKSFAHENEFRIILSIKPQEIKMAEPKPMILDEQIEEMNNKIDLKTIYFKMLNFREMPFELIFHPQCSPWHRENVIDILNKYQLKFEQRESRLKRIFF